MKIYYAHCQSIYRTPQEHRDLLTLQWLALRLSNTGVVVNPSDEHVNGACARLHEVWTAGANTGENVNALADVHATLDEVAAIVRPGYANLGEAKMNVIFKPLVQGCDLTAFRALPDGRIPAGVYKEIEWAREANRSVIELPHNLAGRVMSVDATRSYLAEVGQR